MPLGRSSLLDHAVRGALLPEGVAAVVVVVPANRVDEVRARYAGDRRVTVTAGGAERTDSVRAGLGALPSGCTTVLVHDAARCLTPVAVFDRVISAVAGGAPAVVPGIAVTDTVKVVDPAEVVTGTPDRASLRAIQTPQGFDRQVLVLAHAVGGAVTDDAGLVEALGLPVLVVAGDPRSLKITTALDLAVAQVLVGEG